jgi:MFS family permease
MIGNQNVLRIVGLGAGAGLSGLLAGSVQGLRWLAFLNAASYLIAAAVIVASVSLRSRPSTGAAAVVGWRAVLADRPFLLFCVVQILYALSSLSLVVILPVVALSTLGGPAWLPGLSILLGNVALALVQNPAVHLVRRTSRLRGLALASATFAATFVLLAFGTHAGRGWVVPLVLAASMLGVVGEALFGPLMVAAANDAAPPSLEGRYSALFQTAWGLATVLAPALFTSLLVAGNTTLWLTLAGLALAAVPVLRLVEARLPRAALR